METLYTGHIHGFPSGQSKMEAGGDGSGGNGGSASIWDEQSGLVALGVVLGSSVSLVGLAFAFITYSLFSDLRSLAGTALLSFLASLFMGQLFFVIGVGGIQDTDLCLSLSMAQMFMKLASLAWLCCCCHHALNVFRNSTNLMPVPETHMGKSLAHYSVLSWGFPLLMVAVALAFKYSTTVEDLVPVLGHHPAATVPVLMHADMVHAAASTAKKTGLPGGGNSNRHHTTTSHMINGRPHNISTSSYAERHCWLMEGPAYLWGFLVPGSVLLLLGLWLALQGSEAVKLAASLQVDSRTRNKLLKRRGLQIGLFIKLLILLAFVLVLGAMASLWALPELWAIYSIIQGAQGILTAFLVTCNCRVLKLYTVPRHKQQQQKYVLNKGCYKSLRDCEKGQYGVLSITNPNYDASAMTTGGGLSDDDEEEVDIFQSELGASSTLQHPLQSWPQHSVATTASAAGSAGTSSAGRSQVLAVSGGSRSGSGCDYVTSSTNIHLEGNRIGTSGTSGDCDKSRWAGCGVGGDVTSKLRGPMMIQTEEEDKGEEEDRILTSRIMRKVAGGVEENENVRGGVRVENTSGRSSQFGDSRRGGVDNFVAENNKKSPVVVPSLSTTTKLPSNGKLSGALSISELPRRPLPSAV